MTDRPRPKLPTFRIVAVALALVIAGALSGDLPRAIPAAAPPAPSSAPASTPAPVATPTAPAARRYEGWSDPARVGQRYGDKVPGLLTFRGNLTRTFYGTGPVPRTAPVRAWRFPETGGLCSTSIDQKGERVWCGSGWTGQPAVFERGGRTWVVFGAYDSKIHFLDAATGERILPDFPTGDIIKGSVTVDPDGFPLVYVGSRDNYYRIIAIDRDKPTELWRLAASAVSPTLWNDDWDGAGLVIDDYLFEGGENSQIHVVKLNRRYGPGGKVTVSPKLVFHAPGWDEQLLGDVGDRMVSIESSVAVYGNVLYFANSGGLVQGWDISGLKHGRKPQRVFRFWTGDDTDATIVIDEQGALYVGSEYERGTARSRQVGQMMKLDPRRPGNPLVWKVDDHGQRPGGVWGTPAIYRDIVVFDTNGGDVVGVDRATGTVRWRFRLPGPTWQSPVIVDDVLLIGDCGGVMHAYDVADTTAAPKPLWSVTIGGCVESTPAVWNGAMYFGTRGGAIHALGGPPA